MPVAAVIAPVSAPTGLAPPEPGRCADRRDHGGDRHLRLPGTPYVNALGFDRHKMVQALGLSFTVSTVMLALALALCRRNASVAGLAGTVALVAAAVGMWLGQVVRGKVHGRNIPAVLLHRNLLLGGIWRCAGCCDRLGGNRSNPPGQVP